MSSPANMAVTTAIPMGQKNAPQLSVTKEKIDQIIVWPKISQKCIRIMIILSRIKVFSK